MENGNPISGLNVRVKFEGPETGLGDILSAAEYDHRKALGVVPAMDRPVSAAWLKLAFLLDGNPDLIPMLPPNVLQLAESRPGVYVATLPASLTEAAGTYDFEFQVVGATPVNGQLSRHQYFSRYLRVKPDESKTLVESSVLTDLNRPAVRFIITPRDLNGHRLGPGWERYIRPMPETGELNDTIVDQLDGSYSFELAVDTLPTTSVVIEILGTRIEVKVPPVLGLALPWWFWMLLFLLLLFVIVIFMLRRNP
jgi:hypothetical protein